MTITLTREEAQQVLDALENFCEHGAILKPFEVRELLRARLAQPEPEPVAWISHNAGLYHGKPDESLNPLPLYTTPPQREWVGLTDEEVSQMEKDCLWGGKDFNGNLGYWAVYRAIEAKLKEKNA